MSKILAALIIVMIGAAATHGILERVREAARSDLLRELQLRQIERTESDVREREERIREIEDATPSELWDRACAGGMLSGDACSQARP